MRDVLLRAVSVGAFFLLAACGGGGGSGSSVESAPTPPATPTAFPLRSTQTFQAIHGDRSEQRNAGTGATVMDRSGVAGRDPSVGITYNAADGTYSVSDSTISATLGPAGSHNGFVDTYSKQVGNVSDKLELYSNVRAGAPQSGAPVQLTYLSYGVWTHRDDLTGNEKKSYLLFGYPTADASLPKTGTASYQTAVTGSMMNIVQGVGTESEIGGSASFTADFGSGTVNTVLNLSQVNGPVIGTFNGTGSIIPGSQFTGTFTTDVAYFTSGAFMGGFFGPGAAEMGYNFYARRYNNDPYAGASIGYVIDQWLLGTVVGKKN